MTILTGHIEEGKASLNLKSGGKIGIKPVYGTVTEPFDTADFDFDFTPPPPPEPVVIHPTPPVQTQQEQITSAVVTALFEVNPELDLAELHETVSAAVAGVLAEMADPSPNVTAETAVTPDLGGESPGLRKAAKAREATERSLEKAKESIEQAKRKSHQPDGGTPSTRVPSPLTPKKRDKTPPPPEEPPGEVLASEEQIQILNLLQEGRITLEQAKTLLDALAAKGKQ